MNDKLTNVAARVLGIDASELVASSNSDTIKGWDSLRHWELISQVEQAFGVEFTMDEAVAFQCFGDIQEAVRMRRAA